MKSQVNESQELSTATLASSSPAQERPILFSGPMVKAILEGRKTQTRRVVKGLPACIKCASEIPESNYQYRFTDFNGTTIDKRCPYGRPQLPLEPPRDRLWVRETFFDHGPLDADDLNYQTPLDARIEYRATEWDRKDSSGAGGWTPSIHMPRWASRITLEITDVKVERLQEISDKDVLAEGINMQPPLEQDVLDAKWHGSLFQWRFKKAWDSLYAKRGYGWEVNPWLWVIQFRTCRDTPLTTEWGLG